MKASVPWPEETWQLFDNQSSEERSRAVWNRGGDFHPRDQQAAGVKNTTGELIERRLSHGGEEVAAFYQAQPRGAPHAFIDCFTPKQLFLQATHFREALHRLDRCSCEVIEGKLVQIICAIPFGHSRAAVFPAH